jgi:hypothetical protein
MFNRIETFVFKFTDEEVFKTFFTKYYPLTAEAQIPGMSCSGVAKGDKLGEVDELTELIADLYDVAVGSYSFSSNTKKQDVLERAEKLLGIHWRL